MTIEWADPPKSVVERQRRGSYAAFAEALKSNPARWALAPGERTKGTAAGLAQNIRRGVMKDFAPRGAFEAVHDEAKVYVRYVGAPDVPDQSPAGENGDAAAVREWAKANGWPEIGDRGRLSEEIHAAYRKAKLARA